MFYVNRASHGSSLFEQNFEYVRENFETLRTRGPAEMADSWFERSQLARVRIIVTCRALDGVLAEQDEPFDFLKIDAQGAEHQILKGPDCSCGSAVQGLHLELFTIPMYKGISLLPEVTQWLAEYDFALVRKAPPHGTFDCAHDCVFLKPGDSPVHHAIRLAYGLP